MNIKCLFGHKLKGIHILTYDQRVVLHSAYCTRNRCTTRKKF